MNSLGQFDCAAAEIHGESGGACCDFNAILSSEEKRGGNVPNAL